MDGREWRKPTDRRNREHRVIDRDRLRDQQFPGSITPAVARIVVVARACRARSLVVRGAFVPMLMLITVVVVVAIVDMIIHCPRNRGVR